MMSTEIILILNIYEQTGNRLHSFFFETIK